MQRNRFLANFAWFKMIENVLKLLYNENVERINGAVYEKFLFL